MGKHKAVVKVNDPSTPGCPFPGCIRVVSAELFGAHSGIEKLSDPTMIQDNLVLSPWVRPHYAHPMDFYIPFSGETVYIETVGEVNKEWIWTGVEMGSPYTEVQSGVSRDGINANVHGVYERIFGLRNGTYIKMVDTGVDGSLVIEVMGANGGNPDRRGPSIVISGKEDSSFIAILDGKEEKSFILNHTKDTEEIAINDMINKSWISMKKETVTMQEF